MARFSPPFLRDACRNTGWNFFPSGTCLSGSTGTNVRVTHALMQREFFRRATSGRMFSTIGAFQLAFGPRSVRFATFSPGSRVCALRHFQARWSVRLATLTALSDSRPFSGLEPKLMVTLTAASL